MVEIVRKTPLTMPQGVSVNPQTLQPELPPEPQPLTDGIQIHDPNTGQPVTSELDQIDLPPMNDWLRAIYQMLLWGATSLQALAKTTPAVAALNPEVEKTIDQIATVGYQITNSAAEVSRGLWNWPFARVIINRQIETFVHPREVEMFDNYYKEWYETLMLPVEQGLQQLDKNKMVEWVKSKEDIADPQMFLTLCINRLRMERIAEKSAWSPTDMLSMSRPVGERQKTTTGLERVFRKKPG